MTSFHEDRVPCPAASFGAASGNLRRNLAALLDSLGKSPLARFVSAALDEPRPNPPTGLLPIDRVEVIARRLRGAGVTEDLDAAATCLAHGGWDTWVEEIAPLLRADREATLAALDSVARLRDNLCHLGSCEGCDPE